MEDQFHKEARNTIGVNDAVLLDDPNDTAAFIENLQKRFKGDLIYTYIGPVLISVNPYKQIPIYDEKRIKDYSNVNFIEVPPHIFGLTDNAYRQLKEERRDQCILISGESGSGKTEASKKLLQYIASVTKHIPSVESTKDKLLQSNPVLEAFGNAQTNRNDNSSRFGKYMDIEFDFRGSPIGGHILNYLLEKSRVISQARGERNFHIFYQLISGINEELLEKLKLTRNAENYHYLNQGKVGDSSNDDSSQFKIVESAMSTIGFSQEEQEEVFTIIAGILHVGNVVFTQDGSHGKIESKEVLKTAAKLLGCSEDSLTRAFTFKTIEARGDSVTSPLSYDQTTYARDALSKAIYERLFTWLVHKLNNSLKSDYSERKTLLGILDIYGFEIFTSNSFEQFCINYCNEKLQQLFIELTLKSEQEEYRREGIEWEHVEFFNNKIICDLIEERHKGIISLMDEECLRPGDTSDNSLLDKLNKTLSTHERFLTHKIANNSERKSIHRDEFKLNHYAGEVTYKIRGFLDKNNDLLFRDLKQAMADSNREILQEIFPKSELETKKRPDTAATQFKVSLNQLMEILMSKEPSYIRCIKPNHFKKSSVFDLEVVDHQVKYLGLMENLRVRRAGFAYRRPYDVFLERYKSLCPQTWPHFKGAPKDGVEILMQHLGFTQDDFRMGKTKIFIRHAQTLFTIEDAFQLRKHDLVSKIKAQWRGQRERKNYLKMKAYVVFVQKFARRWLARKVYVKRVWATKVIKTFVKGFIHRNMEVSEANAKFIQFVRYRFLMKLKESLPKVILKHDSLWPEAPPAAKEASKLLCSIHLRHLVRKYVRNLTPERKSQLELKLLAHELFKGKKACYEGTVRTYFLESRITGDVEQKANVIRNNLKNSNENLQYMTRVSKYDCRGYKERERILCVTKSSVYLYDAKDGKTKFQVDLKSLSALTVTNLSDGLLVLRVPPEMKKLKGDYIFNCPNVVEAVTYIIKCAGENKSLLTVESLGSDGQITHKFKGKTGVIHIEKGDTLGVGNQFRKRDGHLLVTASG